MEEKKHHRWLWRWLLVFSFMFLEPALFAQNDYIRPNYEALPIPAKGLSLEPSEQDQLLDALASLARDFDGVPEEAKAKAVAVSRRIDPLHKATFIADYQLSRGVAPGKLGRYQSLSEAAAVAIGSAQEMGASSEKSEQLLALHLFEFLGPLVKGDARVFRGLEDLGDKGLTSSWDNVFIKAPGVPAASSLGDKVQKHRVSLFSTKGMIEIAVQGDRGGKGSLELLGDSELITSFFMSAFREGVKFLEVSQSGALEGVRISFDVDAEQEEDFFDYQGPAGALPTLVTLQAMIGGTEIDPLVAFAGDVNADGSIQPVYDILERIEGLGESDSMIIGIAATDYPSVSDAMIIGGPRIFAKHQFFTLKQFSDAVALGRERENRDKKLQEAIDKFRVIQDVLTQPDGHRHLKHPSTINKLREVLTLAPNHLSARMLGLWATNQVPNRLSLTASLDLVVEPVFDVLGGKDESEKEIGESERRAALQALTRMQSAIDPRLGKLTNAVIQYSNAGRIGDNRKAALDAAKTRLRDEYEAVVRQPGIREELMR